jgi:GntR family transcriptional repressor for pyruvate dehydrogenase complex
MNLPLTPLPARTRRSAHIAESLRQLITSGQLKPGDRLPTENALCQQFGVSRTTLREAIQMLRTTGLLDVCPGRGSFVSVPDLGQLMRHLAFAVRGGHPDPTHVTGLRLMLERDALTRLSTLAPAKRQELYHFVLSRTAPAEENAHAEEQWHLAMATLAGNPLQCLLVECLLMLDADQRRIRYADADEVLRTIQVQLRVNTAIAEGDFTLADRVLSQFIALGGASPHHLAVFPMMAKDAPAPDAKNAGL